jgi:hypothetical protein
MSKVLKVVIKGAAIGAGITTSVFIGYALGTKKDKSYYRDVENAAKKRVDEAAMNVIRESAERRKTDAKFYDIVDHA